MRKARASVRSAMREVLEDGVPRTAAELAEAVGVDIHQARVTAWNAVRDNVFKVAPLPFADARREARRFVLSVTRSGEQEQSRVEVDVRAIAHCGSVFTFGGAATAGWSGRDGEDHDTEAAH